MPTKPTKPTPFPEWAPGVFNNPGQPWNNQSRRSTDPQLNTLAASGFIPAIIVGGNVSNPTSAEPVNAAIHELFKQAEWTRLGTSNPTTFGPGDRAASLETDSSGNFTVNAGMFDGGMSSPLMTIVGEQTSPNAGNDTWSLRSRPNDNFALRDILLGTDVINISPTEIDILRAVDINAPSTSATLTPRSSSETLGNETNQWNSVWTERLRMASSDDEKWRFEVRPSGATDPFALDVVDAVANVARFRFKTTSINPLLNIITRNVIPEINETYDAGSVSNRFNNVRGVNLHADVFRALESGTERWRLDVRSSGAGSDPLGLDLFDTTNSSAVMRFNPTVTRSFVDLEVEDTKALRARRIIANDNDLEIEATNGDTIAQFEDDNITLRESLTIKAQGAISLSGVTSDGEVTKIMRVTGQSGDQTFRVVSNVPSDYGVRLEVDIMITEVNSGDVSATIGAAANGFWGFRRAGSGAITGYGGNTRNASDGRLNNLIPVISGNNIDLRVDIDSGNTILLGYILKIKVLYVNAATL